MEITIPTLQRQRAHLTRCQRSVAFDFAITVLGGGDCEELRFEYRRLGACIAKLDEWIGELEIAERGRWAIDEVERILEI